MPPVQAITRKAVWAEEDAALSKYHADKRAAMGGLGNGVQWVGALWPSIQMIVHLPRKKDVISM